MAIESGLRLHAVAEHQIVADRDGIQGPVQLRMGQQGVDGVGETEGAVDPGEIEGHAAELVAGAEQATTASVPDREGEIADQALDAFIPPGVIGVQNQGAVRDPVGEMTAPGAQIMDQRRAAVDAGVGHEVNDAIEGKGLNVPGLLERRRQQGLGQKDRSLAPPVLTIRPEANERRCHGRRDVGIDAPVRKPDDTGDPAHGATVGRRKRQR